MLDLNDVSVTFHAGTVNERKALDHVSLHLDRGEFVCVLGTNGAGKSTLLNAVSGTLSADSGTITLDGMDLTRQPEHKRARYIGRLFQDPMKGTAPDMSIVENLGLAYSRGKRMTLSRAIQKKDRQLFHDRLSQLGLGLEDHTAALDPNTAAQVMKLTDQIIHENQITTLMITHNLRQALEYGTKTLIMNEGKIVRVLEGEEKKQTSVEELLQMYDFV